MLDYVRFRDSVSMGGDLGALDSWSRDKHANQVEVEEKGNYLILHILRPVYKDGTRTNERTGKRRRLPITSVSYFSEQDEPSKEKK